MKKLIISLSLWFGLYGGFVRFIELYGNFHGHLTILKFIVIVSGTLMAFYTTEKISEHLKP